MEAKKLLLTARNRLNDLMMYITDVPIIEDYYIVPYKEKRRKWTYDIVSLKRPIS